MSNLQILGLIIFFGAIFIYLSYSVINYYLARPFKMKPQYVVIATHGEFNLSHKAIMLYSKLSGVKIYPYNIIRFSVDEERKTCFLPVDKTKGKQDKYYIDYYTKEKKDGSIYESRWSPNSIKRDDPYLVQTIKTLGNEANPEYGCRLKVIELPHSVDYYIDDSEYGQEGVGSSGSEIIREVHRTWEG